MSSNLDREYTHPSTENKMWIDANPRNIQVYCSEANLPILEAIRTDLEKTYPAIDLTTRSHQAVGKREHILDIPFPMPTSTLSNDEMPIKRLSLNEENIDALGTKWRGELQSIIDPD